MNELLKIESLRTTFSTERGLLRAVDGVDLEIRQGVIMGLIGPNGAGKTTLMNALSGFVPLTGGQVSLAGEQVAGLSPQ